MNDMRKKQMICLTVALLGLFAARRQVEGQEIAIVFPAEYENVEAPVTDTSGSVTWPNGARIQYVIPADAFASLPETHRWVTELRQRPDSAMTSPRTLTTDMVFRISTTSKDPERLSVNFAAKIQKLGCNS